MPGHDLGHLGSTHQLAPPPASLSSEEGTHFADPKEGQENQQETWETESRVIPGTPNNGTPLW